MPAFLCESKSVVVSIEEICIKYNWGVQEWFTVVHMENIVINK